MPPSCASRCCVQLPRIPIASQDPANFPCAHAAHRLRSRDRRAPPPADRRPARFPFCCRWGQGGDDGFFSSAPNPNAHVREEFLPRSRLCGAPAPTAASHAPSQSEVTVAITPIRYPATAARGTFRAGASCRQFHLCVRSRSLRGVYSNALRSRAGPLEVPWSRRNSPRQTGAPRADRCLRCSIRIMT